MAWQLWIGISILSYSASVLLQRLIMRESDRPVAFAIFFQLFVAVLFAIAGLALGKLQMPDWKPLTFNLLLSMVLYGLGNIFIFKSLNSTEASRFTVVFASRTFFTVLASSILLRELLNATQWMGAVLIFAGAVCATAKKRVAFDKGELFAILAAIVFGFAVTNDRFILQSFEVYTYSIIGFLLPAIFIAAAYPREVRHMKSFLKKETFLQSLAVCFIYALFALTFYMALQEASNSSQVAAVSLSSVILTVILSIIFLKEREFLWRKIFGAVICSVGLLLLL